MLDEAEEVALQSDSTEVNTPELEKLPLSRLTVLIATEENADTGRDGLDLRRRRNFRRGRRLISKGQILAVGRRIQAEQYLGSEEYNIINGRQAHYSRHHDEHSHIIIERGVNEGTQIKR